MINFCPHCGNRAKQEKVHSQQYDGIAWGVDDGDPSEADGTYHVYLCTTCREILVYHQLFDFEWDLVYPEIRLDRSVAKRVAKIYDEAIKIKRVSPNSFAVQIRRALEALCIDRGIKPGNLASMLTELSERGEIPTTLSEAGDILRLIGNLGAHADEIDVHPLQVMAIDDFFKSIIEYVYVLPNKIQNFKDMLQKYKGKEK
jgi:hypothetical protein